MPKVKRGGKLMFEGDDDEILSDEEGVTLRLSNQDADVLGESSEEGDEDEYFDPVGFGYKREDKDIDVGEERIDEAEGEIAQQEQSKQLKRLQLSDFNLFDSDAVDIPKRTSTKALWDSHTVQKDLSAADQEKLLHKKAPELAPLEQMAKTYADIVRKITTPIVQTCKKAKKATAASLLLEAKQKILQDICMHTMFYGRITREGGSVRGHPVVDGLVELNEKLEELNTLETHDAIQPEVDALISAVRNAELYWSAFPRQEAEDAQDSSFSTKLAKRAAKTDKKRKRTEIEEQPEDEEEEPATSSRNPRGITKKIFKPRGLTASRNKKLKNPRMRAKHKYKKQVQRANSALPKVRKSEATGYAGEKRINLFTTHSRRLK